MKKMILSMLALTVLAGCTGMVKSTEKASAGVRRGIYDTAGKVQELTRYNPGPTDPQAPQEGYCYKAASDIICYDAPQGEIPNKLTGYQQGVQAPGGVSSGAPVQSVETVPMPMPVTSHETPFYVKEAPYVKSDGEVVGSSKSLPDSGSSTTSTPPPTGGNPQRLMPRY